SKGRPSNFVLGPRAANQSGNRRRRLGDRVLFRPRGGCSISNFPKSVWRRTRNPRPSTEGRFGWPEMAEKRLIPRRFHCKERPQTPPRPWFEAREKRSAPHRRR